MGQSSVWFATHLSVKWFNHANTKSQIKFSHHKAFIGVDDIEESEEDIDGNDFQGVKDDHADLHVVRAGKAGSCLHKICSGNKRLRGDWKHKYGAPVGVDETSNIVLAEKK